MQPTFPTQLKCSYSQQTTFSSIKALRSASSSFTILIPSIEQSLYKKMSSKGAAKWLFITLLAYFMADRKGAEALHRIASARELMKVPPPAATNRTGYHFQAFKNWINDPNGPMYYKGFYHLFYQFNPKGPVWGNIVWAHSYSTDMINWNQLDIAITPSKPFDVNGCWSGSATILPGGKPAILYTGVDAQGRQVQNVAFPKDPSDPHLRKWVKPDYNPVIDPAGTVNASAFRDPTTAWRGPDGLWRIVVGSQRDSWGEAVLYRSRDFVKWEKAKSPLHTVQGTGMWECPDFFPVSRQPFVGLENSAINFGSTYLLKVSLDNTRGEYYTIGLYDSANDKYVPDGLSPDNHSGLRFDYGNFYASKTFYDQGKKRRILWGWSNESDTIQDDWEKGWAGVQAIPRALWLDSNGRQVMQWPIEEVEELRHSPVAFHGRTLHLLEVKGIHAAQADVDAVFDVSRGLKLAERFDPLWTDPQKLCAQKGADVKGSLGPFGLYVLATADLQERTAAFFRVFKTDQGNHVILMCHDPTKSSKRKGLYKPIYGGFVDYDISKNNGRISLRTLIDHSVVESFGASGRTCITSRVYPSYAVGSNARLFAFNNGIEEVKIELKAWEMRKPTVNGI